MSLKINIDFESQKQFIVTYIESWDQTYTKYFTEQESMEKFVVDFVEKDWEGYVIESISYGIVIDEESITQTQGN